jgi:hypothetical protein
MSNFYKVLKADPLGEPWTPNAPGASPIQNYWSQIEGEDWPVSIGKQLPNTVAPGDVIYGDLMKETSKKGTDYWKFKSARIPEGTAIPAGALPHRTPSSNETPNASSGMPGWFIPVAKQIEYIYKEMKKVDGDTVVEDMEAEAEIDSKAEVKDKFFISPEQKAIMDDIFGGPIEPTEIDKEVEE